jgi:hypothetical protein
VIITGNLNLGARPNVQEELVLPGYPRPQLKTPVLKRITEETKFHIDFEWWGKSGLDLKTYLLSRLDIPEGAIAGDMAQDEVDLVDAQTGEVRRVDGFQFVLQTYFSQLPEDFVLRTSLVDAIFFVLLANANQPLAVSEIADRVHRPPDMVMRTLSGKQVYQGIRPIFEEERDAGGS